MFSIDRMTDDDFQRHALTILRRQSGLDGLARFLRLNRADGGDYTRDRHRWHDDRRHSGRESGSKDADHVAPEQSKLIFPGEIIATTRGSVGKTPDLLS